MKSFFQDIFTNFDKDTEVSKRNSRIFILFLVAFVIALSIVAFSRQSLRLDESQSIWQSSHSLLGLFNIVARDVHVPLYEIILHFWQIFFGNGVAGLRALSMVFFIFSIPLLYYLGSISYTRTIGLWVSLIFAISPFMNWYGNEIRMYSLFVLLTILNQIFFIKILKYKKENAWWGYAVTAFFGIYTHYFFGLTLLSQAIFYFFNKKSFIEGSFKKFVIVASILLISLLPWLAYVVHVGQIGNSTPLLPTPTSVNLFGTFFQFLFGFQSDHLNTILVSLWPISVLLGFLALRKNNSKNVQNETIYFLLSVIFPISFAFAISIFLRPVYLTRYLIFTLPSLYLFLGWLIFNYKKKLSFVFRTILILLMLTTLGIEIVNVNAPIKEDYKSATNYLELKATAQDIIVMSAPFTIYPVQYYYNGPAALSTLPIWDQSKQGPVPPFDSTTFPNEVETLKDSHQNLWLLLSVDQGYQSEIKTYFDSHFQMIDNVHFSYDLDLYEYKLRYDGK